MTTDNLLIKSENEQRPKFALITDDHLAHIMSHAKHAYSGRMLLHIGQHVRMYLRAKRLGIQPISLEDVIEAVKKRDL